MVRKMKRQEFQAVYDIMERSFPVAEYRRREEQERLLEEDLYTVWCYESEGMVRGFAAVWSLEDVWFLEHLAVDPAFRGEGYGGLLLDAVTEMSPGRVLLEVEPPDTPLAQRRIGFYTRHGFCINPYPYQQPSISRGKPDVPLRIMSYPAPLDAEAFLQAKKNLYRIVYKAK